ncbi:MULTISPECIES: hypothetical protein [Actinomadura]|uniref:Uncharacterized protein n=1 Tax=Actinomadura yumaensis TaxID=111807 RepID=A0ABW2CNC1_9ACTN|nr:hypothetical protein [Actinomadura sp. J1-007]MWK37882.1 hypothetical protein [Actinomadura sp. J1-007]
MLSILSGLLLMAGGAMWLLFVAALLRWLIRSPMHRWLQEVDRNPAELTVPLVYAPLLSGAAAVGAGAGVNLYTSSPEITKQTGYGAALVLAALGLFWWYSLALLRYSRDGGRWLARARYRLHRYGDPRYRSADPAEHARETAQVRRLVRVGHRLTAQADRLTLWKAEQHPRRLLTVWLISLTGAILLSAAVIPNLITHFTWLNLGMLTCFCLAPLVGPLGLLLRRNDRRWALRQIGTELISEGNRAAAALARHAPPSPPNDPPLARLLRWGAARLTGVADRRARR